jgi:MurNAc alpha-1-phosphate uridylyltransferase
MAAPEQSNRPMDERFKPDVMLLAAGLGTRLRPLTATMPKPLVRVGGRPLIDHVLAEALDAGLGRFVVNAHHHASQLADHVAELASRHPEAQLLLSREDDAVLGTGGGVKRALPLLTTDPVLVMNTDAFWLGASGAPIRRLIARHAEGGAEMVLLCVHPRDARGFRRSHDFCLDPTGRITSDAGAPVIYAGACLLARALFAGTPEGPFSLTELFDRTRERGSLAGVVLDAPWLHVGDPEGLAEAEAMLKTHA